MPAPLLTPAEMAEMDRRTIEDLGVPGLVLMESAASACVHELLGRWEDEAAGLGVLVIVGPGNNGADGLAIARRLVGLGIEVEVSLATPKGHLGQDAATQLELAEAQDVPVHEPGEAPGAEEFGVVVDALFGTGLSRGVEGVRRRLSRTSQAPAGRSSRWIFRPVSTGARARYRGSQSARTAP